MNRLLSCLLSLALCPAALAGNYGDPVPLGKPLPLAQAIFNGLTFFGQGTKAPHWTYDIAPAARYLTDLGNKIRTPTK